MSDGPIGGRLGRVLLLCAGVALLLYAATCRPSGGTDLPELWRVPGFELVDQTGDTLRAAELEGEVWATSFVFTSCRGICPAISAGLASIRDSLAADGLLGTRARLVSVSVDPARDTVAALRRYAEKFGGSPPDRWAFLTGSPPDRVRSLIQRAFKVTAMLPDSARASASGGYRVDHAPTLLLVDRDRRVRGIYNARDPGAFDSLQADLRALAR